MASPPRSRRVASKAKAASFGKKRRSPSPSKAKAGKTTASTSGKRNAVPKAKQNAKALPRPEAARLGKGSRKSKKIPGTPRTVNLADRTALLGRYQPSEYFIDALDEIRQDIAGLRSDVQDLGEKCRDANRDAALAALFDREARRVRRRLLRELSGGERVQQRDGDKAAEVAPPDKPRSPQGLVSAQMEGVVGALGSDKQLESTPDFRYASANYELLKQQTKRVSSDAETGKRVSLTSLTLLLGEMLAAGAYDAAENPTAFMVKNSGLDERTARRARTKLFDDKYISAKIKKTVKLLNTPKKKRLPQNQEYWSDVRLTVSGVELAQFISSLNLPHLKHLTKGSNSVDGINSSLALPTN